MSDQRTVILETVRQMCSEHLVLGTWGNVSARAKEGIWITPSGLSYEGLGIEDLVLIDDAGKFVRGKWRPSSEWRLHTAIYQARPDCMAVIHTHSVYATAFAVARNPIPPVVEDCAQVVGGAVDIAEYALPGSDLLAKNAVRALGLKSAVLLANHGPVAAAANLNEALKVCQIIEKTAQAVLLAKSLGQVFELSEADVLYLRQQYTKSYGPSLIGEEEIR
jgi:L-fuculose-phosphate aldolase